VEETISESGEEEGVGHNLLRGGRSKSTGLNFRNFWDRKDDAFSNGCDKKRFIKGVIEGDPKQLKKGKSDL